MAPLQGTPISPGIAIGKVFIREAYVVDITCEHNQDPVVETKRFHDARQKAIEEVTALYESVLQTKGEKEAAIFMAHLEMLDDVELIADVERMMEDEKCNAEWALEKVSKYFIDLFHALDNVYMRERAMDIHDISNRIQRILAGYEQHFEMNKPGIIVSKDLTPSDTAQLDTSLVRGIVNEVGGSTSHAAILARMMGVPFVTCPNITSMVHNDQMLVFDGQTGVIEIDPSEELVAQYEDKLRKVFQRRQELEALKGIDPVTKDGFSVILAGNIGMPKDVKNVLEQDAQAVGLFRTEFLYMSRQNFPEEDEQFDAYKEVLEKMQGRPVVIRTLDIGGDKELDYLEIPHEMNPFLGCRAIRFCLNKPELWKVQIRALLRASVFGDLHIMIPMIVAMEELLEAKAIIEAVKVELREKNIPFNEKVPVGMMMETPSAALMADMFAPEVDFFSIGTNDLIQYTIAVDRMNDSVAHLYSPYQPAVLRLIKNIVDSAHKAGIWAGMCGEAASDPKLLPVWLGMGLDELSMSPRAVLEVKERVLQSTKEEAMALVEEVLKQRTVADVKSLLS